jgi:hypothetical protein
MLPTTTDSKGDSEFTVRDGNTRILNAWLNKLQRGIVMRKGSGTGGTFPSPPATTEAWGGAHQVVAKCVAGVTGADKWTIDDAIDWRNRIVRILAFGAYNASNRLPGESNYACGPGPGYDYPCDSLEDETKGREMWTGAGANAADPPTGGPYLTLASGATARGYLFVDDTTHALRFWNATVSTLYPYIVVEVSDQFPTRT